jgi:hypothetical protein
MLNYTEVPLEPLTPNGPVKSRKPKRSFKVSSSHVASSWRAARDDVRSVSWKPIIHWVMPMAWLVGLLAALIILLRSSSKMLRSEGACTPDGSFSLFPSRYNVWSSSSFFQITLGFGHYSFSTVKTIDIAWDIVSFQMSRVSQI